MKIPTSVLVFAGIAAVSGTICYVTRGGPATAEAARSALYMLAGLVPQLLAGLLIGALATRLVSREKVAGWLGEGSGTKGLFLAMLAGMLTPGGPFTSFPLVLALWTAGADAGALIAYIAAWSMLGFNRLIVWELPLLGAEFSVLRMLVSLPLPLIGGLLARQIVRIPAFRLERASAE